MAVKLNELEVFISPLTWRRKQCGWKKQTAKESISIGPFHIKVQKYTKHYHALFKDTNVNSHAQIQGIISSKFKIMVKGMEMILWRVTRGLMVAGMVSLSWVGVYYIILHYFFPQWKYFIYKKVMPRLRSTSCLGMQLDSISASWFLVQCSFPRSKLSKKQTITPLCNVGKRWNVVFNSE